MQLNILGSTLRIFVKCQVPQWGTIGRYLLHLDLPRKSFLGKSWQFGPKLDQDFATLYLLI